MPDLNLELPSVPEGFCNSLNDANWVQTLMNLIAQGVAKFEGSGFSVVLNQSTAPGVNDRDKLWRDTDTGRIYNWSGGAWVTPHPYAPDSPVRLWWTDDLTALETFDGGSVGAVSTNSGPMWVEDTNYRGRFPLHVGTLPTSGDAVALDDEGGVDEVTIPESALPEHKHDIGIEGTGNASDGQQGTLRTEETNIDWLSGTVANSFGQTRDAGGQTTPEPLSVLNPYRAGYWIKRSARVNYVGA